MKQYLIDRMKEASTWRGIILVLTAVGVPIAPELQTTIVSAGLGLAGLLGAITPDK